MWYPSFLEQTFHFHGKILNTYAFLVELRKLKPTSLGGNPAKLTQTRTGTKIILQKVSEDEKIWYPSFLEQTFHFYGKILNTYAFLVELRKLNLTFLGGVEGGGGGRRLPTMIPAQCWQ